MKITFNHRDVGDVCIWYTELFWEKDEEENRYHKELRTLDTSQIIDRIKDKGWKNVRETRFYRDNKFFYCDIIDDSDTILDTRMIPIKNIDSINVSAIEPKAKNEYSEHILENEK